MFKPRLHSSKSNTLALNPGLAKRDVFCNHLSLRLDAGERDGERKRKPTVKGICGGDFQNVFGFVSIPALTIQEYRNNDPQESYF